MTFPHPDQTGTIATASTNESATVHGNHTHGDGMECAWMGPGHGWQIVAKPRSLHGYGPSSLYAPCPGLDGDARYLALREELTAQVARAFGVPRHLIDGTPPRPALANRARRAGRPTLPGKAARAARVRTGRARAAALRADRERKRAVKTHVSGGMVQAMTLPPGYGPRPPAPGGAAVSINLDVTSARRVAEDNAHIRRQLAMRTARA